MSSFHCSATDWIFAIEKKAYKKTGCQNEFDSLFFCNLFFD